MEIFSPFVLYVGDMIGRETLVIIPNLSRLMAAKMDEFIFHVRGWINGRISIVVAKSYLHMIRRA